MIWFQQFLLSIEGCDLVKGGEGEGNLIIKLSPSTGGHFAQSTKSLHDIDKYLLRKK